MDLPVVNGWSNSRTNLDTLKYGRSGNQEERSLVSLKRSEFLTFVTLPTTSFVVTDRPSGGWMYVSSLLGGRACGLVLLGVTKSMIYAVRLSTVLPLLTVGGAFRLSSCIGKVSRPISGIFTRR